MNKKNTRTSVFVGGPITNAISKEGSFNSNIYNIFELLIDTFETAGLSVYSAHRAENYGKIDVTNKSRSITTRDFNWMKCCSVYLAILPGDEDQLLRTDGTCVELGWASVMNKPIIIVREDGVMNSHLIDGLGAISKVIYLSLNEMLENPIQLVKEIQSLAECKTETAS